MVSTASSAPIEIGFLGGCAQDQAEELRIASAPMIARTRIGLINLPSPLPQHDRDGVAIG